jgi:flagellar protein FlbT
MALKVELKPNERIIVGTVVIRADDQRTKLFIEGQAPILREKDILTARTADTPAKRIYLTVQLMYLDGDSSRQHDLYFDLIRDFLQAAPSARSKVSEINNCILSGDLYKALKAAKALIAYEAELMAHVPSA